MSSQTDKRRQEALRTIVSDYIASQEPVDSEALMERHNLGVSSVTIRNDMAVLEAEGYIQQEHASSGRIPTQKGCRLFVNNLPQIKPLSRAERRAILESLEGGVDLEDILRRSVQLLAQLTRQVAVMQAPTLEVSRVRRCEVVQLADARLLLVVITDTGRVEQRNIELPASMDPNLVPPLREHFNRAVSRYTFADASIAISDFAASAPRDLRDVLIRCSTALVESLTGKPNDRLTLAGTSNLTRGNMAGRLPSTLPMILEALEEQVVVPKLLSATQDLHHIRVSIDGENEDEELRAASVVSTGYGTGTEILGGMGVVGPTFMGYPGTVSSVAAVAQYIGRVLKGSN